MTFILRPTLLLGFICVFFMQLTAQLHKPALEENKHTQIMVLATQHLEQIEDFDPADLHALLEELEKWKPEAICLEAHAAKPADLLGEVSSYFINETIVKQAATKLAESSVDFSLEEWLNHPSTVKKEQRAHVLLGLLANRETYTAVLKWKQWFGNNYSSQPILSMDLDSFFVETLKKSDERVSIGLELAGRLGHERVYHIDDHTDKPLLLGFQNELVQDLQQKIDLQAIGEAAIYQESSRHLKQGISSGNLLSFFQFLNGSAYQKADVETQWHLFFQTDLTSQLDRSRAALWEVRNLNMASHIRRATTFHQGQKVLVIVGAGHKPFLDAYLSQMMDVTLINLNDL
ncbi:MAG: DUF5694 domain-containing protein [Bacteroidota bacterium]